MTTTTTAPAAPAGDAAPAAAPATAPVAPAATVPAPAAPAAPAPVTVGAATQVAANVSAAVEANKLADAGVQDFGAPAPAPAAAPAAEPTPAPTADAPKADAKVADARAALGYTDVPPAFESAANLAVELGVPSSVIEGALDINTGKLDVSKLGNLSPRDAAVLKSEAERCVAEAKAAVAATKAEYQKAVGGEAQYAALVEWARNEAASNAKFKAELADLQPLIKNGGKAGTLAVKELFAQFSRAAGTSMHAQIARAMVGAPVDTDTNPRAALDKGWEQFAASLQR